MDLEQIKKVAVIGSGVMGSGIAAHLANAGCEVVLLDIVPKEATDRSVIAKSAIQKLLKTNPAPLMHKRNAKRITPGNIEDDLEMLGECDWIIEVVLENLKIKHTTYEKIDAHRKKGSIVSSNTSTIPLEKLIEGQSADFAKDFMITHFFNPPRYLRLLEMVVGDKTDPKKAELIAAFCDVKLGKGVVHCNDTPGFIGNRIGTFWIQAAINEAAIRDITIEEADAVMGRPIGVPKTGVFALVDLVGVDLMPHLAESMLSTLPEKDMYRDIHREFDFIDKMIADGYTGRKGKGGFYRLDPESKKKTKQRLDLKTGAYIDATRPKVPAAEATKKGGMKALIDHESIAGEYAWEVLAQTLSYAAGLVGEIADNLYKIDQGMKLGYNWKKGPFEMLDEIGPAYFANKLKESGKEVPDFIKSVGTGTFYKVEKGKLHFFGLDGKYHEVMRPEGVLLLEDVKRASDPVHKNGSASLWDIGDKVLCLEFHTKMNAIDEEIFAMIKKAIQTIGDGSGDYKALVVHNEGSNFSAGANLGLALFTINVGLWSQIDSFVGGGQDIYKALKFAPFPTVGAPSGMALGGGCEILLHCDSVQAHAESYIGLVEVGVGIIPGWGGCKEMLLRHKNYGHAGGPMPPTVNSFQTIGTAQVAKSAYEAYDHLYMIKDRDGVTMNKDRVLFVAKQKALALAKDYKAPEPDVIKLSGATGKAALDLAVKDFVSNGKATPHDVVVSEHLAYVLTGGDTDYTEEVSEDQLYKLEKKEFMKLVKNPNTIARIEHMLEKGKPLRN